MVSIQTLKQDFFRDTFDLVNLNIIDWNRLNGHWQGQGDAMQNIASWFLNGNAAYTVMSCDLREAPEREDWPGWEHVGHHVELGKQYWNWFHWSMEDDGTLEFSDQPDFTGTIKLRKDKIVNLRGDIGKVSASTFSFAQKEMRKGDIWVSVTSCTRQVVIEACEDIHTRFREQTREQFIAENRSFNDE